MDRRKFLVGSAALAAGLQYRSSWAAPAPIGSAVASDERIKSADELVDRRTADAIGQGLRFLARKQVRAGVHTGAFGGHGYAAGVAVTALSGLACLLYTSPSPRDRTRSRMPSSA